MWNRTVLRTIQLTGAALLWRALWNALNQNPLPGLCSFAYWWDAQWEWRCERLSRPEGAATRNAQVWREVVWHGCLRKHYRSKVLWFGNTTDVLFSRFKAMSTRSRAGFHRQEVNKTIWEVPERYRDLKQVGTGAYGTVWWVTYTTYRAINTKINLTEEICILCPFLWSI